MVLGASYSEPIYIIDRENGKSVQVRVIEPSNDNNIKLGFNGDSKYQVLRARTIKKAGGDYEPILRLLQNGDSLTQDMIKKLDDLKK